MSEHVTGNAADEIRALAPDIEVLAQRLGLTPRVERGLREVFLGEWEAGLFRKMVAENHPVAERMWAEERWDVIPGAELASAFADRVGVVSPHR